MQSNKKNAREDKFRALFMGDETRHLSSILLKRKTDLITEAVKLLNKIKADPKIDIKIIRCASDNEEMDRTSHEECLHNDINIPFIGTSSLTPPQNYRIQHRFATCFEHVHTKNGDVIRRLPEKPTMTK